MGDQWRPHNDFRFSRACVFGVGWNLFVRPKRAEAQNTSHSGPMFWPDEPTAHRIFRSEGARLGSAECKSTQEPSLHSYSADQDGAITPAPFPTSHQGTEQTAARQGSEQHVERASQVRYALGLQHH